VVGNAKEMEQDVTKYHTLQEEFEMVVAKLEEAQRKIQSLEETQATTENFQVTNVKDMTRLFRENQDMKTTVGRSEGLELTNTELSGTIKDLQELESVGEGNRSRKELQDLHRTVERQQAELLEYEDNLAKLRGDKKEARVDNERLTTELEDARHKLAQKGGGKKGWKGAGVQHDYSLKRLNVIDTDYKDLKKTSERYRVMVTHS
jgi:chromosome segregation ATPase